MKLQIQGSIGSNDTGRMSCLPLFYCGGDEVDELLFLHEADG